MTRFWLTIVLLSILTPTVACAADVKVTVLDQVKLSQLETAPTPFGRPNVRRVNDAPKDMQFGVLYLKVQINWSKKDKNVAVREMLAVIDGNGKEHKPIARLDRFNKPVLGEPFNVWYRKDKPTTHLIAPIFLFPKEKPLAALRFQKQRIKLANEFKTKLPPHYFVAPKLTIVETKLVEVLPITESFRLGSEKYEYGAILRPVRGKILIATIRIEPRSANFDSPDTPLNLYSQQFGVVFNEKGYSHCIGVVTSFGDKPGLAKPFTYSLSKNTDGSWSPSKTKMAFVVPKDAKTFAATFLQENR